MTNGNHPIYIRIIKFISLYTRIVIGVYPMKAFITHQAWVMPEGTYYKALRAKAEVINGSISDLLWDLTIYRYALQKVVDALWDLDRIPKRSQLHQLFYSMLRGYGFRAHVARNIYDTALTLVKSVKTSGGSKPIIRRMTARLDYQDARVDIDKSVVKVIIKDKWYVLRIKHRREYVKRFRELRWKEVHVKYDRGGCGSR